MPATSEIVWCVYDGEEEERSCCQRSSIVGSLGGLRSRDGACGGGGRAAIPAIEEGQKEEGR